MMAVLARGVLGVLGVLVRRLLVVRLVLGMLLVLRVLLVLLVLLVLVGVRWVWGRVLRERRGWLAGRVVRRWVRPSQAKREAGMAAAIRARHDDGNEREEEGGAIEGGWNERQRGRMDGDGHKHAVSFNRGRGSESRVEARHRIGRWAGVYRARGGGCA